jgi:hypothetical protein
MTSSTRSLQEWGWSVFLSNLIIKVCALVLINKLCNPFSFKLTSCSHSIWIRWIRLSKIKMMGGVFDVYRNCLLTDIGQNTTCVPRINITITENDVWSFHEVSRWDVTTEVVQSPAILWRFTILKFALKSVLLFIPLTWWEHTCRLSTGKRHRHFVTILDSPSVSIETAILGGGGGKWNTLLLASVVKENHSGSRHRVKINKRVIFMQFCSSRCLSTCIVDWPCRKWFNEVCCVWVIDHDHCAKSIIKSCWKYQNVGSVCRIIA